MFEKAKTHRRMAGVLAARLPDLQLSKVEDPRRRQGRRWRLPTLLTAVLAGLVAGRKSLAEVEAFVTEMASAARRQLGLPAMLADTTLRDVLVRLAPFEVRQALHRMVKAAWRRKALPLQGFPFHVLALDGKVTAVPVWDHHYAQQQTGDEGQRAHGLVRMVNAVLVSTPAKPVVDSVPIPAETNEMGIFPTVFEALVRVYGELFKLVTYDAGANSAANARLVVEAGKHYLFHLKNEARFLMRRAIECVGPTSGEVSRAQTTDTLSDKSTVVRSLFVRQARQGFKDWCHLRTVFRVRAETFDRNGVLLSTEDRYFLSSLPHPELSWAQWLSVVRHHWVVENNCHWTLDAIFREDDHPWIEASPRGTVAVMLLRRIAYNLVSFFRSVTQRSHDKRETPWRTLLRWFYNALIAATDVDTRALRRRDIAAS